jgi:hypothetical protein
METGSNVVDGAVPSVSGIRQDEDDDCDGEADTRVWFPVFGCSSGTCTENLLGVVAWRWWPSMGVRRVLRREEKG